MSLGSFTIGKKITVGFGIILFLFASVVGIGIINANIISDKMGLSNKATQLVKYILQAREDEKDYVIYKNDKFKTGLNENVTDAGKLLARMEAEVTDDTLLPDIAQVGNLLADYHAGFGDLVENNKKSEAELANMDGTAEALLKVINDKIRAPISDKQNMAVAMGEDVNPLYMEVASIADILAMTFVEAKLNETAFILHNDESYTTAFHEKIKACGNIKAELFNAINVANDSDMREAYAVMDRQLAQYKSSFGTLLSLWKSNNTIMEQMGENGNRAIDIAKKIQMDAESGMIEAKDLMISIMTLLLAIGIVAGLVMAFFIVRSISRALRRAIEHLNETAEQFASASNQISSSSQQLAEGASEQASSLEEMAASMEEISAMSKQNAESSAEAVRVGKDTANSMASSHKSLKSADQSMKKISADGEKTARIVKTIDEIAFQINLLALNAAVEAARAGEAGAGFAVVAGEVRTLALRSAEAARDTADLIGSTLEHIREGNETVAGSMEEFHRMGEGGKKVTAVLGEINTASNEQARGVEQLNIGVQQMERVTQQTAANAEESASAAEEMNAQAAGLMEIIKELQAVVGGGNGRKSKATDTTIMYDKDKSALGYTPAFHDSSAVTEKKFALTSAHARVVRPVESLPREGEAF